jgi:hypothetical protein
LTRLSRLRSRLFGIDGSPGLWFWGDFLLPLSLLAMLTNWPKVLSSIFLIVWLLGTLICSWSQGFGSAPLVLGLLVLFGLNGLVFGEPTRPVPLSGYIFMIASASCFAWRFRLWRPPFALWFGLALSLDLVCIASFLRFLRLLGPSNLPVALLSSLRFDSFIGELFQITGFGVNNTAFALVVAMLCCLGLATLRIANIVKIFFGFSGLFYYFLILLTQSRAGVIMPFLALAFSWFTWFLARRKAWLLASRSRVAALLLLVAFAFLPVISWFQQLLAYGAHAGNALADLDRLRLIHCYLSTWASSWKTIVFGFGYGNAVAIGCGLEEFRDAGSFHHAHNAFVHILAENGLLLFLALALVVAIGFLVWLRLCSLSQWSYFLGERIELPIMLALFYVVILSSFVEFSYIGRRPLQFVVSLVLVFPCVWWSSCCGDRRLKE